MHATTSPRAAGAISARFAPRIHRLVAAISSVAHLSPGLDDEGRPTRLAPAEPIDVVISDHGRWQSYGVLCDLDGRGARLALDSPPPTRRRLKLSIPLTGAVWQGAVDLAPGVTSEDGTIGVRFVEEMRRSMLSRAVREAQR